MSFSFLRRLSLLALALLATGVHADPESDIRTKLKTVLPDTDVVSVLPTPVRDLYHVTLRNYEPILATADGRYIIQGEMLEIRGGKIVSVADQMMADERKRVLATVRPDDMVIFPAVGKARSVIYVFTDVDCGYCRKFHNEVPELNKKGVEVRYLAFPRAGANSVAATKLANVWCAKDRGAAMTQAKRGTAVPAAASLCKPPIKAQYDMGGELGVRGTPAIFDEQGMQLGGYLPADKLAKALNLN